MYKKIPKIASTAVVLTACTSGMGLLSRVQNKDIVEYCENLTACYGGLYGQFYTLYCVDELMDARQTAKAFDCESEFDAWMFCEGIQSKTSDGCPFDYDSYDDWYDARYEDNDNDTGYYGYYTSREDPCEDEEDDLNECTSDFLGNDTGEWNSRDDDSGDWGNACNACNACDFCNACNACNACG